MADDNSRPRRLLFVTGRLAAHAVSEIVAECSKKLNFRYSIEVMPITVAALMTPQWLLRHLEVADDVAEVILPGFIGSDIQQLQTAFKALIRVGPKDLRDLPEFLGTGEKKIPDLSSYSIEIIAEINHAPRISIDQLLKLADELRNDGADRIDVGCQPGERWNKVGEAVKELVHAGHKVSIDSFDDYEVAEACRAGATLVLSVNSSNVLQASKWETEVVVIPDEVTRLESLYETIEQLDLQRIPYRIDPILEPIGMGIANSIVRYQCIRQRYPEAAMMMGIGNLTELTDVDSAGVNMLLLGICAELRIHSVLTTQVINWARTSVRECDRARRIVDYAVKRQMPPKRIDDGLVMLRDAKLPQFPAEWFDQLANEIRDNNYRLFAQQDKLHLVSAGLALSDTDPFRLFEALLEQPQSDNVDVSHAFYLGYELAKARIALTLSKQYNQDQSLDWGILSEVENLHRLRRGRRKKQAKDE